MTNNLKRLLVLTAAILLPLSAHAQLQRAAAKGLSNEKLLEKFARSITKDPTYVHTERFLQQWESLQQIGINLGETPVLNSGKAKDVEAFHANIENAINNALTEHNLKTVQLTKPNTELSRKLIRDNRDDLAKFTAYSENTRKFEWGIPGINLVQIRPVTTKDFANFSMQTITDFSVALAQRKPKNMSELIRFTADTDKLDFLQKIEMIQHLSAMKEVMVFDFLNIYIERNATLPIIANMPVNTFVNHKALKQFAKNEIKAIVKNKIDKQTITTPVEFNRVQVLSRFCDQRANQYLIVALLRKDYRLIETLFDAPAHMSIEDFNETYKLWGYLTNGKRTPFDSSLKPVGNLKEAEARKIVLDARIENIGASIRECQKRIEGADQQIQRAKESANKDLELEGKRARAYYDTELVSLKAVLEETVAEWKTLRRDYNLYHQD